jgi:pimeloyl-ACP methyl ester carboxylesterase
MTNAIALAATEWLSVGGMELEVIRCGAGRPVLLLHGMQNIDPRARFLDLLGRHAEIIAPSHPGFGHSALLNTSLKSAPQYSKFLQGWRLWPSGDDRAVGVHDAC